MARMSGEVRNATKDTIITAPCGRVTLRRRPVLRGVVTPCFITSPMLANDAKIDLQAVFSKGDDMEPTHATGAYRPRTMELATTLDYYARFERDSVWVYVDDELAGRLVGGKPMVRKQARWLAQLINCGAVGPQDGFGAGFRLSPTARGRDGLAGKTSIPRRRRRYSSAHVSG